MFKFLVSFALIASSSAHATPVLKVWDCKEVNGEGTVSISRSLNPADNEVTIVYSRSTTSRPEIIRAATRIASGLVQYNGTRIDSPTPFYISIDPSKKPGEPNAAVQKDYREVLSSFTCVNPRNVNQEHPVTAR